ncbi:MAG: adenine deaminase [Bacteroidetes bacterium]|nr:MAG: adenine deaminase [Bacteroidota bacterium]
MAVQTVEGLLVDLFRQNIYPARISFVNTKITSIEAIAEAGAGAANLPYILPGFIDAHVHIESSMMVPSQFARMAVVHGTVATVSDPHEIANVCGMEGVDFMISDGKKVPFKFYFGAPSCVPATIFETAGAALKLKDVEELLQNPEIKYLSEMMNFPGVLYGDPEVMGKIHAAVKMGKPIDGHAPGLRGDDARNYIEAGTGSVCISTDHECFTREEALDKLKFGMKVIIREGSAARNFEALADLINDHSDQMMFCSDDKHPDSLELGHINQLCTRAIKKGIDIFKVLKVACLNPVNHYKLNVGLLRVGDPADFILATDLEEFKVLKTFINGELVAENGQTLIPATTKSSTPLNNFHCEPKTPRDFEYKIGLSSKSLSKEASVNVPVIEALDGQLITNKLTASVPIQNNMLVADAENDILKIVVVNRYKEARVSKAFIKNFGLKKGAIASSVAHDSHNIVAVGSDDESLCEAVNLIIQNRGGVSCVERQSKISLIVPLPVAGLMNDEDGYEVARMYAAIDKASRDLGSKLGSPFMTLSFMALLVIPHLKLSDLGLFDGDEFRLIQ